MSVGDVCFFMLRKGVDFVENVEFMVYITADIFHSSVQLGARNFPSVIWLEGLEQEGYSSLYG
jgi:hypothetical protein